MVNGEKPRVFIIHNNLSRAYKTIGNNETVSINGFSVKAFVTPGHTAGSTCYLVDGAYLFTGDAISIVDNKIGVFNEFFNMDTKQAETSIDIITSIRGVDYIFTAHYGYVKHPDEPFADWNSKHGK